MRKDDCCGIFPHDSRCPWAVYFEEGEKKVAFICQECGQDILEDERYFKINQVRYCAECMDEIYGCIA